MPARKLALVEVEDFRTEISNIDWNQVLIDASIAALQGIQETSRIGLVADALPDLLADRSVAIGKALVQKLQAEMCPKTGTDVSELSPDSSETRK